MIAHSAKEAGQQKKHWGWGVGGDKEGVRMDKIWKGGWVGIMGGGGLHKIGG